MPDKKPTPKQTSQTRMSRKDQMKQNPVPWIILLVLAIALYFFLAHGKLQEWNTNKEKITENTEKIDQDIAKKASLEVKVGELQEEFQDKAGDRLQQERKLFPEKISNKEIVKYLEIFMLKLKNIESKEDIRLNTLSVAQNSSSDADIEGTERKQINFSVDINQEELETLIWYLQNNEIPPRMVEAKENGKFQNDLGDYITLEGNPLPMMLIENINKSGGGNNEDGNPDPIFNVSISGNLYHQAIIEENGQQ